MILDTPKFVVTTSIHGMKAIEVRDPSLTEWEFLRSAVTINYTGTEQYELRNNAGAFLQCDDEDYVLIEFWKDDYEPFVQWLNDNYCEWARFWEEECI